MELKEILLAGNVISEDDKSYLQEVAVEAIEELITHGWTATDATRFVSWIISATRESYGD